MPIFRLTDQIIFPPAQLATREGLLAVGGDLSPERLLLAYREGIFPWYSQGQPILWWSPDPRMVLFPDELVVSKSLRKVLRKNIFRTTIDRSFFQLITACAQTRIDKGEGTWITDEMIEAYDRLHRMGYAHSIEVWHGSSLVGGCYGVALGRCFFGESMFSLMDNASKIALVQLVEYLKTRGYVLIDCQVPTDHLKHMGARNIARSTFLRLLEKSAGEDEPHYSIPPARHPLKD